MSHHHQSHKYQPQNPSNAAQTPTPAAKTAPAATKPKACEPGTDSCSCQPSADHIRVRAYEISQARNGGPGNASSDWSQAEKELTIDAATNA